MTSSKRGGRIRGVAEEVVVISPERRDRSYATQLAAGVHIVALGDDLTRLVFRLLSFPSRISASHVCVYWRALAVGDPLLWTVLDGDPALIPILWARAGSATAIDVCFDLYDSSLEDVVSCISNNLNRMTSIRVVVPVMNRQPSAGLAAVLDVLIRPMPRMRRLHLEAEWFEALSDGRNMSCSLAPLGPSCRLRELALLRTIISDFTVLPATLTRFAYGDPSCSRVAHLTLLELEIILRTCPALKSLWLSVSIDLPPSGDDIDISTHPLLQLEELSLGWTDATITQHLLDSLSVQSMRYVDVGDCETDPIHGVLQGFEGHTMSIFPSTSIINGGNRDQPCNLLVSDSSGRTRSVREADFMLVREYETLWSHLVSLTIYNDGDEGYWNLTRPPPHMPCLQFLRMLYDPSSSWELSEWIEILEPWGRRSYDYDDDDGGWNCPSLHTVEFAPAAYRDGRSSDYDDAGSSHYIVKFAPAVASQGPNIITIRPRHILAFVTRELASAPVSRVIFKGDGIRIEPDADEELELPFSLSYDPSDCTIHAVDRYGFFPFNGFHSE